MTAPNPAEVMAVIARRGGVLRSVGTDGIGKRDLVEQVDVSRSTVDRSVRELESKGLIERTGGGYRRTLAGEVALREYDTFASRIEGVVSNLDLLESLPADVEVDAAMFDDATVVEAERHSPHKPVTELCDLVSEANAVQALVVAVFPQLVDAYVEGLESGMTAELILSPGASERLVADHGDAFREGLATGRLTVREADSEPAFGLLVVETDDGPVAAMLLYGEGGVRAFVRNDDDAAVEWARSRLTAASEASTPMPGAG